MVFRILPNSSTSELVSPTAPNLEVFVPGNRGPAIQPHLQSVPEVANSGWRDYGNKRGLQRLVSMFKNLGIPVTAVINSEAAKDAHCERSGLVNFSYQEVARIPTSELGYTVLKIGRRVPKMTTQNHLVSHFADSNPHLADTSVSRGWPLSFPMPCGLKNPELYPIFGLRKSRC